MNKYKGIIYKITNNLFDEVYYGSTIRTLKARMNDHKNDFKAFIRNNKRWCQSFQIIMDDNYKIEKIEDYPCNSIEELKQREDYYILNFDNINQLRAHNTPEVKKAKKKKSSKIWNIKNREEKNSYYHNNLLAVNVRGMKKIKCKKCNKIIRYDSIYKHRKSNYCLTHSNLN